MRDVSWWRGDHQRGLAIAASLAVVLGGLLALPLPATNYPFGLILLTYAIALIERDGRLMAIAWALGVAEIATVALFSGQIAGWVAGLFS